MEYVSDMLTRRVVEYSCEIWVVMNRRELYLMLL
jgi:hypothetical protein